MESLFHYINEFWGVIFGTGGIFATILSFSYSRRLKKAEATASEITNLQLIIDSLKSEIKRLEEKQQHLEKRLDEKDNDLSRLYREIDVLDKKYLIKKKAINCAIECRTNNNDCPVLLKLAELENDTNK